MELENVTEDLEKSLSDSLNFLGLFSPLVPVSEAIELETLEDEVTERLSNLDLSKATNEDENWPLVRSVFMRWWCTVHRLRTMLLNGYQRVILADLEFCNAAQVEHGLWKCVFYSVVELLRSWIVNPLETGLICPNWQQSTITSLCETLSIFIREICLTDIIKPGQTFLHRLLLAIQQNSHVHLGLVFNTARPPPETNSRIRKLVYISAQKLLLSLGDLARYQQVILGAKSFGKSRACYQKAQLLVPKNGRCYNQLAVLALYTVSPSFCKSEAKHRYFDAMLYFMRSLGASNSFNTATQSLAVLFNELSQRMGKMVQEHCANHNRISITGATDKSSDTDRGLAHFDSGNRRVEVWYHPIDGAVTIVKGNRQLHIEARKAIIPKIKQQECSSDENEDTQEDATEYANVPLVELNRKFALFFITAHGKLFTKIGMENFPEVASLALQSLSGLLVQTPCPMSAERLCQILLVNMFNVDRAASLTTSRRQQDKTFLAPAQRFDAETLRSVHHDHASRLALDTMAIVARRASKLMQEAISNNTKQLPKDLSILLPMLRLWTEWMILHPEHWSPPPNHRDPTLLPCLDDWALVADLCSCCVRLRNMIFGQDKQHLPEYEEEDLTTGLVLHESALTCDPDKEIFPKLEDVELDESKVTFPLVIDDEEIAARKVMAKQCKTFNYAHLEEEVWVSGFKPMLDMQPKRYRFCGPWEPDLIADYVRLESLIQFGDYLCGIESPVLNYDVASKCYTSVVEKEMSERKQDTVPAPVTTDAEFVPDLSRAQEKVETSADPEVQKLFEQRAQLQRRVMEEERLKAWRKFVIREAAADGRIGVEIEVHPVYILPDTNCYIDWLEGIATLAQPESNYTVLVPIVVLNELEKLANPKMHRGRKPLANEPVKVQLFTVNSSDEEDVDESGGITHSGLIKGRARAAIDWLELEFEARNPRIKALTTQGNMMDSISYRSEIQQQTFGPSVVNDDIILSCCRHFCQDAYNVDPNGNKPLALRREIVLLTSDRNLRIKALNINIPAPRLFSFISWTRLPSVTLNRSGRSQHFPSLADTN
ncbi:Smg-6, nonsense mediated mRNA decay factor [Cichlidogyrus casuarinus]|uniref:Smg-6, nonsense mediated mRNA decay factor n=1 Tax=Cichlidogyrus casuarinus TaxID=1844966 RepID=A0ABD2Q2L9_9PLAT